MLFLSLYQVFVFLFPLTISWSSADSSQKLWKRQTSNMCPNSKWKEFQGACFLEVKVAARQRVGHNLCRNKFPRSQVTKIRSRADLDFIKRTFTFEENYWIGLSKTREGNWYDHSVWEDGSKATYVNFPRGQPTYYGEQYCVALLPNLGFYDTTCLPSYFTLCYIEASENLCITQNVRCHENATCYNTFSSYVCVCNDGFTGDGISTCITSIGCPNSEWKEHKGLCYRENVNKTTFEDAQNNCSSEVAGSSLAKIRYQGDRDFLLKSFNFSENRWLGLRKTNTWRDQLTWDDQSNVSYKIFQTGQPNDDGGGESCMVTNSEGEWNDVSCASVQGSFCSINAMDFSQTRTTESSSEGISAIIVVFVGLLVIGAFVGYKKCTDQPRDAQNDPLKPNDSSYQEYN